MSEKIRNEIRSMSASVFDYLKTSDTPEARVGADIVILHGEHDLKAVADKAFELYKENPQLKFIATAEHGNYTRPGVTNEAQWYRDKLVELGIPEKNILWNSEAKNTIQELQVSLRLAVDNKIKVKKVIQIASQVHQKRALLNALKIYKGKGIQFVSAPSDDAFDISKPDCQLRLVEEIERLITYGDLVRPYIPPDILNATACIRSDLRQKGIYSRENHPQRKYHYAVKTNPKWANDNPNLEGNILPGSRSWEYDEVIPN